jgi:hypothetical protein
MEVIRVGFIKGNQFVFETDIKDFFGSIDHERLLNLVAERARGALTSSGAIFMPACPASSGSSIGSSATTSIAGRRNAP